MSERKGKPLDPERRVIAVTGVRSFAGAEVVKRLEEDRRVVRILAVDVQRPEWPLDKVSFYKVDLTLPTADADLAAILRREGVDTLVHAAFLAHPTHATAWAHELEDIGTMHVLNACAASEVARLVLVSTTMVYGPTPANPNYLTEEHPLRGAPGCGFIQDKVSAEEQVRRFRREHPDVAVTVVRAAPTIGPTARNWVTKFFSRPVAPVLMGYDPLVQLLHEDDLVTVLKRVIDTGPPGEFNLAADGVLPYSTVLALMGKVPLPLPGPLANALLAGMWATQIADSPPELLDFLRYLCVVDTTRAKRHLGFQPRHDIRSAIDDFLGLEDDPVRDESRI